MAVVEISDFECPFCRASNAAVDSALRAGLKIAYLNYPLQFHPQANGAASAALCAGEMDHFREMHDRLMSTTQWQTDSNWTREAEVVGLPNMLAFAECLGSTKVKSRLAAEQALVAALKVRGTPTFVARGHVHEGTISFRELMALGDAR